jgi:TRAP-type C4-dicarboxylate transport system permease small subunit
MRKIWLQFSSAVQGINILLGYVAALLIVASTLVISFEVVSRYVLRQPHSWNLELNIFFLIAATFLAAAFTQMKRGHVGIDILDNLLSARWNRWRYILSDVLSLVFCATITYYIWKYFHQAWAGGWVSDSTWGPKVWIPYSIMGAGMTALCLQLLIQIIEDGFLQPSKISHEVLGE